MTPRYRCAMPDRRSHRGKHPDDEKLFAPKFWDGLRSAVAELSWLLSRRYTPVSALKLVGDRHGLTARQRMAVRRSACADAAYRRRGKTQCSLADCAARRVAVDGYNLLITVESALSGGLVIVGRDGCHRDLAGIHGTYRKVEETIPALELTADCLAEASVGGVDWYLDRPVANSGRLKALLADLLERRGQQLGTAATWNIELASDPDAVLAGYPGPVVTSDSVVLDSCPCWVNLAGDIIRTRVPQAWIVDLRREDTEAGEG